MSINSSGRIVVVSAPSGTGKTTLNRRLVTAHADKLALAVSYTTRKQRQGERDGVDYHYVAPARFRELIASGKMLEYAEVFGTLYGTSLDEIDRIQQSDRVPLLEIDVQGWRQARTKLSSAESIFILPPSIEALWKRLENRGTEAKDIRWNRLMTARAEISSGSLYRTFIVNNDIDQAYHELEGLIIRGTPANTTHEQGIALCHVLLEEFDAAPWLQTLSRELAAAESSTS